jgi:hypothetical protein
MVRFGWLYKDHQETTYSDLFKEVTRALNLSMEYFLEWKKFYFNVYRLIGKFNGNIQRRFHDLNRNAFYFKVENDKCEPLLTLEELRVLNCMFENHDFRPRNIEKLVGILKLAILYFLHKTNPSIEHSLFEKERILKICIGGVSSPLNIDLKRNVIQADGRMNIAYDGGKLWFPLNLTIL